VFAACLAVARPTRANEAFGPTISGVVRDSSGAPLGLAQVIIAEAGRTTSTDDEGRFAIRGLPPGTYHLTTLLIGYRPGHAVVRLPTSGPDVQVTITMIGTTLRLQAVSVTAASNTGEATGVAQSTAELSGTALQRSIGNTLAQTLSAEPGMAVRYNGPAATMPVIRGLSGDRILVLQDGARTGDLSSAAPDHATSIDPLASQRIEVVRGPASLLYGNNALGGVVNVISNDIPTDVPGHIDGSVAVQGESVNPGGAFNAGVVAPLSSSVAINVRGGARHTDDIKVGGGDTMFGTSTRSWNALVGLGIVKDQAQAGLALKAYDFNYGLPAETPAAAGVRIDGHRYELAGRLAVNTGWTAIGQLRFDGTAQDYAHQELAPDGSVGTAFKLKTETASLTAPTHLGRISGTIGLQGLFKQYSATGDEALTPAANSSSGGAFLFQEFPLNAATEADVESGARLQVGARYDAYRIESMAGVAKFGPGRTVDLTNFSGSLGVTIPVSSHVTLSGSVARAFRAPTVEELFSNAVHEATGSYEYGNPNLQPEHSLGVEGVLRIEVARLSGQFAAYANKVQNYVAPDVTADTVVDGETMPLARYGQHDATLRGLEGQLELKATSTLVVGLMGDLTHGEFAGGAPLPFMPAARVGGSLRWDNGHFNIGGDVRHSMKQTDVTGGQDVATDAYTVANLSAGFNLLSGGRLHTLTLRLDNVGDVKYYDATSRIKSFSPNPGRNAAVVYKVTF
jgi:iron complex outermembrane receptor protein